MVERVDLGQNPKQQLSLGDNLIRAGQALSCSPNSIFAGGMPMGFCMSPYPLFPVPGLDASDIMVRRALANLSADVNIPNTNTSSTGVTDSQTEANKTKNPAEPLSNIGYEKITEMANKENEIKKKQEQMKTADEETKKTLSKEIYTLKEEYSKLDKEIGKGVSLIKSLGGKEFNFYSNISEKEFEQIQDFNNQISQMKEHLQKITKEATELQAEYTKTEQELKNSGKPCDRQSVLAAMGSDKSARYENIVKDREDTISSTEKKIKELKSCIQQAAKDTKETDFYTHIEQKDQKASNASNSQASKTLAGKIQEKMFDNNGKLQKKEDVEAAVKEDLPSLGGDYTDEDINKVLNLLYDKAEASEGMSKADYQAKLKDAKFFDNCLAELKSLEDENVQRQASLLVKLYDKVADGTFTENGKAAKKDLIAKGIKDAADKFDKKGSSPASSNKKPPVSSRKDGNEKPQGSSAPVEDGDIEGARQNVTKAEDDAKKARQNQATPEARRTAREANEDSLNAKVRLAQEIGKDINSQLTTFYQWIESKNNDEDIRKMDALEVARLVCEDPEGTYKAATACKGGNNVKALGIILKKLNEAAKLLDVPANQRFHLDGGWWNSIIIGNDNISAEKDDEKIGEAFTATCGICDSKDEFTTVATAIREKLKEKGAM